MTCFVSLNNWCRIGVVIEMVVMALLIGTGTALRYLGNEAIWRDNEDSVKRAMLMLDPTQQATNDGYVTGWHVYTTRGRRSQQVYLQIWRPVRPAENRYLLVGETLITALWVGHNYFALYPQDRIAIERGNVLGIYFPKYNPIPWTAVKCHQGNQHLYKYNPYTVTSSLTTSGTPEAAGKKPRMEVVFITGKSDWEPCRQYSLNATIMTEQEMAQYDFDYDETTDGRYERRPYGQHLPRRTSSATSWQRPPGSRRPLRCTDDADSDHRATGTSPGRHSQTAQDHDEHTIRCLTAPHHIVHVAISQHGWLVVLFAALTITIRQTVGGDKQFRSC